MGIDWESTFVPTVHLAEIVLRGSVIYLSLFFCLRFFRREAGGVGIPDVLLIVLIADAAQNAMSSDYKSITEGLVLVGTIVFWNYALDWLACRYPRVRRLVQPKPLSLVEDGRMNRRNMRHEMISEEELSGRLREQGVDDVSHVKSCHLESDGQISVIKKDGPEGDDGPGQSKKQPPA